MKPIWVPAVAALLATAPLTGLAAGPAASSAEAKAPFCAVQPVQEYFTPVAGDGPAGVVADHRQRGPFGVAVLGQQQDTHEHGSVV